MSRETCRAQAVDYVESGRLKQDLARLVARQSVSHSEGKLEELWAYLAEVIGPLLQDHGFEIAIHDNPLPGGPPLMIASHIEGASLPAVLGNGHGDVCNGEAQGLTPSERVFGWNSFALLATSSGAIAAPQSAISGMARAVGQLRFVVGTDVDDIVPALRRHLDTNGFEMVEIACRGEPFKATRFSLDNPWVRFVCESVARSTRQLPHILPNLAGSLPNAMFVDILGLPTIWLPHAHAECGQHGPNEHALLSVARQAMVMMTELFLDIADGAPRAA